MMRFGVIFALFFPSIEMNNAYNFLSKEGIGFVGKTVKSIMLMRAAMVLFFDEV